MKKVLIIILVIAFVLIFLAGGVVAKVNEDAFFDKLPIAYHNLTYDFMGEIEKLEGDDFGELLLDIPDFLVAPFVYFFDALRSTAFLLRAEPEQMVLQKYGGRVYVYSNSRAGIDKVRPTKVNSIEECTDWRKQYVLPDGYIYAARQVQEEVYFDILQDIGYEDYKRINSSGLIKDWGGAGAENTSDVTGFIPVKSGDIVRVKNMPIPFLYSPGYYYNSCAFYRADKSFIKTIPLCPDSFMKYIVAEDGCVVEFKVDVSEVGENFAYIRLGALDITSASELYVNTSYVTTWKWYNTNRVYDDTEYADSNGGFYDGWLVADYEKTSYLSFTTPAKPGYVYKYDLNQGRFTAVVLPSVSLD